MNYFTEEIWEEAAFSRTAGNKARNDIASILKANGFKGIAVSVVPEDRQRQSVIRKAGYHLYLRKKWEDCLRPLQKGDVLLIQFPVVQHSVLLGGVIRGLQKRGVKVILLIHDLEILRTVKRSDIKRKEKLRLRLEEEALLQRCDGMIVHNRRMKAQLAGLGYNAAKMTVLEIFDYLVPETEEDSKYARIRLPEDGTTVIVAGVLRRHKAGYTYALPESPSYHLYGVDYEGPKQDNVHYFGSFPADELPGIMEGSFGLVWDGDSTKTCSGTFGQYMKINNPHKASLYLASGLPVLIWKEAALAEFILSNECGCAVGSLEEISEAAGALTKEQYDHFCENAKKIAKRLRGGKYTMRAVERAIHTAQEQDR